MERKTKMNYLLFNKKASSIAVVLFVVATLVLVVFTIFSFIEKKEDIQSHFPAEPFLGIDQKIYDFKEILEKNFKEKFKSLGRYPIVKIEFEEEVLKLTINCKVSPEYFGLEEEYQKVFDFEILPENTNLFSFQVFYKELKKCMNQNKISRYFDEEHKKQNFEKINNCLNLKGFEVGISLFEQPGTYSQEGYGDYLLFSLKSQYHEKINFKFLISQKS